MLVDDQHVLTCAHVIDNLVPDDDADPRGQLVQVQFLAVPGPPMQARVLAEGWSPVDEGDLAVLELTGAPPAGVVPALLRRPPTLTGHRFSVLGFPFRPGMGEGAVVPAAGKVLAATAGPEMTWTALVEDTGTPLAKGFSGCPVWDDDAEAVVGITVATDHTDGARLAYLIPTAELARRWPPLIEALRASGYHRSALRAFGHWDRSVRGVQHQIMPGQYFTGRRQVLTELTGWLAADPVEQAGRPGLRVVTGGPGSGKSAVLARLVITADPALHQPFPTDDLPGAAAGSIDVALHVRAARTDLLLGELGEALDLDVGQPGQPVEKRVDRLLEELAARHRPVTVVVDALDEAAAPAELADQLLRPLLDTARSGIRLLIGGRAEALPILRLRPEERQAVIDLDDGHAGYFNPADLVGYVQRRLLLDDDPQAPTPYRNQRQLAGQVAEAVAARAGKTFLIAQLEARSLTDAAQPIQVGQPGWQRQFPVTVGEAIDRYLTRLGPDEQRARNLLAPLVWAFGSGLPYSYDDDDPLWPRLATALAATPAHYTAEDVEWLLDVACSYLITLSVGTERRYRLFHQAMVDHLQQPPRARHDPAAYQRRQQARYTDTLLAAIPRTDGGQEWSRAPGYLLEQLPAHAAAGGRLDELHRLLTDFGWLHAKLAATGITAVLADYDLTTDPDLRLIQGALRLSAPALMQDPGQLPGQLIGRVLAHPQPSIQPLVDQIRGYRGQPWLCPRTATLALPGGPLQYRILTGITNTTWTRWAPPVAVGEGRIVSVLDDWTVRVWDLATGRELHKLAGSGLVTAVAVGEGRIVSGSRDGTVRVWDLATGRELHKLAGHTEEVAAVAAAEGRIVSGSRDGTVRVWDLATGRELHKLAGSGLVTAVAVGEGRIVSGSRDGTVRVWDLATGRELHKLAGHTEEVAAVAAAEGRIVSGSRDGTVRVWDLPTGRELHTLESSPQDPTSPARSTEVQAVAVAVAEGRIVSGTSSRISLSGMRLRPPSGYTLRVWDLHTGQLLHLLARPHRRGGGGGGGRRADRL